MTILMVDPAIATPQFANQVTHKQTSHQHKAPDLIATGQKSFEIPFSIDASQNDVVEVVLQMSSDQGQTWKEHSRRSPGTSAFPFSSRQDGEFMFAIQTVDRNGKTVPTNQALTPELRIAVDTQRPEFNFEVRPDATGRIVGVWTARDKNIDPCSLVIQYQSESSTDDNWYTVPAKTCQKNVVDTYRDQLAWWPQTTARNLRIKATIKDLAGNEVVVERAMLVPLIAGNKPSMPVGNHLRSRPTQTAQNTIQLNQTPNASPSAPGRAGSPNSPGSATTNYLRSRLPYALSDQYGQEPGLSANRQSQNPGRNQLRQSQSGQTGKQPDQSSNRTWGSQGQNNRQATQSNASHRQASMTSEPTPQPPMAQSNRFASNTNNASNMTHSANRQSSGKQPATRWRSRRSNDASAQQVSSGSTESWKQPASNASPGTQVTTVQATTTQEYYNQGNNAAGSNQSNARQVPHKVTRQVPPQDATSLKPAADPMRPQAPFIPDQSEFRNDSTSANGQWISSTTGISQRPAPSPSSALATGPKLESLRRSARPSNSKRFQLEYDIDAIGPEGVKSVELWATKDGGNSWRRLTTDADQRSPVNVAVDSQGIFGFRILVISNEGLRARQPRSGDPADMWVNVDTTNPAAEITGVPYGRGPEAGKLVVQWRASDANLKLRPAKLSYSPGPQGPWTTIEDGIRNEGHYAWKPGVNIPDKVYLQLQISDVAGNVAVHKLNRPVDVSGLIPRGHIRGITPIRELPRDLREDTDT